MAGQEPRKELMTKAATISLMTIRIMGMLLLILGMLFWTGRALALVHLHMLMGFLLVCCSWFLGKLLIRAKVHQGLAMVNIVWGALLLAVGIAQLFWTPGGERWIIQTVHAVMGLGALALAEIVAGRLKRSARGA